MPTIDGLLRTMVERGASDLHLATSLPPHIRMDGDIMPLPDAVALQAEQIRDMLDEIMTDDLRAQFSVRQDADFAYELPGVGRFRVNALVDRLGVGAVMRMIPTRIPTADELGLPQVVRDFCALSKGLVVVTGPTGSGKSTTLAAMVDLINKTRSDHIITIEDPIEFVHVSQRCLVTQREVHSHTDTFASALRAALREDPNIVLVGELRDLETMEIAIETAETGHLVLGTLHTNTAATTVSRIIEKFPAAQQNQIRSMLADSLKGVVAQILCKKIPNGRVAAMEVLVVTPSVSASIREGKTHQIPSSMQTGKSVGMQMFDDALLNLVIDGKIDPQEALAKCVDRQTLLKRIESARAPAGRAVPADVKEQPVRRSPNAQAATDPVIQAVGQLRATLAQSPDDACALNNLAWILATAKEAGVRNSAEAIDTAERARSLTGNPRAEVLDTLAAAYAAGGQYDSAVKWAREGVNLADAAGQTLLAEAIKNRIALYANRQPVAGVRRSGLNPNTSTVTAKAAAPEDVRP